jgi:nicotinate-nucleotide pyrophosphorylase (carboxylating)
MSKRFYETEASGGVTLKNVRKIAGTGVERISIGQITHSAQSINFKLDFIS